MSLSQAFDNIAYLAERLEDSNSFDADLRSFLDAVQEMRTYLYRQTNNPVVIDHLDYLGEIDLSPPEQPLLQSLLPKGQREMYGRYQHREKLREEVRKIAARFVVIRRLL